MKALEWTNVKEMRMKEMPEPVVGPGWVLLRVAFTGICGSELSAYVGQNELRKPPSVMGHEFSGTVMKAASQEDEYLVGKKVTVNPLVTCGKCKFCRRGDRQLCPERKIIGVNFPGSFAQFVAVPASSCYITDDLLLGSLTEPLATAFHAVRKSSVEPGDRALVIGAGTIGLMATAVLKLYGASTIAVSETNRHRLEWSRDWGADVLLDPSSPAGKGGTGNEKYDVVIDAVGLKATRKFAINSAESGGRVMFVGLHEPEAEVPGNLMVRNEISVSGSFCYTDEDYRRSARLINSGFLSGHRNWYDVRELERGNESFMEQLKPDSPFSKIILSSGD
jgi:2-desacetyl-2-hydroxyethyl bacteriochlorophyllide A dehydrogenase